MMTSQRRASLSSDFPFDSNGQKHLQQQQQHRHQQQHQHQQQQQQQHQQQQQQQQWDSFAGFCWNQSPSTPDLENFTDPHPFSVTIAQPLPPSSSASAASSASSAILQADQNCNSVLATPMLPAISAQPVLRQQRSLSFSMGQDPSFFGYDDYDDGTDSALSSNNTSNKYGYKTSLEPMAEEDDEMDSRVPAGLVDSLDTFHNSSTSTPMSAFDLGTSSLSRIRARSQSSGATFGHTTTSGSLGNGYSELRQPSSFVPLYQHQHQQSLDQAPKAGSYLYSPSEEPDEGGYNQTRRSSLASLWNPDTESRLTTSDAQASLSPSSPTTPYLFSTPSYKDVDQQDTPFAQSRLSHQPDYSFPEKNQSSYSLLNHQRRKSCNNAIHPLHHGYSTAMRGLTSQLENINIQSEPPSPLPFASMSTPYLSPHGCPLNQQLQHDHHQFPYQQQQQQQRHSDPSLENGQFQQQLHQQQQQMVYHQQTQSPPLHSSAMPQQQFAPNFSMHPYQQVQETQGMLFHCGLSSLVSPQQKSFDNHHRQQKNQHQQSSPGTPTDHQTVLSPLMPTTSPSCGLSHQQRHNSRDPYDAAVHSAFDIMAGSAPSYASKLSSNGSVMSNGTAACDIVNGYQHQHQHHQMDPRIFHENGKGVPLHRLPPSGPLYMVEFKAGRIDFYYISPADAAVDGDGGCLQPIVGDLVIVEADRGKDLGKVAQVAMTCDQVLQQQQQQQRQQQQQKQNHQAEDKGDSVTEKVESDSHVMTSDEGHTLQQQLQQQEHRQKDDKVSVSTSTDCPPYSSTSDGRNGNKNTTTTSVQHPIPSFMSTSPSSSSSAHASTVEPIYTKRIYRLAAPDEINMLLVKSQDEQRALVICQQKIKQRKLQMEAVDAEYQWDRRKLTFYFSADKRIDFRELVREMFKIYKTRIWMCAVNNKKTNVFTDRI